MRLSLKMGAYSKEHQSINIFYTTLTNFSTTYISHDVQGLHRCSYYKNSYTMFVHMYVRLYPRTDGMAMVYLLLILILRFLHGSICLGLGEPTTGMCKLFFKCCLFFVSMQIQSRIRGYKTVFMLNTTKHDISTAHKN